MKIVCPYCTTELDVGDERRSVVAICHRTNKVCDNKTWANPKTRVFVVADDDGRKEDGSPAPTHVLQTDPPWTEEEQRQLALTIDQTIVDESRI